MLEKYKQELLLGATKEFKGFLTDEEYNQITILLTKAGERKNGMNLAKLMKMQIKN